jgi:hypothetical protein
LRRSEAEAGGVGVVVVALGASRDPSEAGRFIVVIGVVLAIGIAVFVKYLVDL